ncbi:MAG: hypothetical protein HQK81_01085 [Desulfovibrionaceae bacterium]|nr:hypothetical protein [Desulfovibrionaceae bacterium]
MKDDAKSAPTAVIAGAWLPAALWTPTATGRSRLAYLGQDAANHDAALNAASGQCESAPLSELLSAAALAVRSEYIALDAVIAGSEDDLAWQASDLAERNPYTSSLFHDVCALLAALTLLEDKSSGLIFLVENPELALVLGKCAQGRGWNVRFKTGNRLLDAFAGLWPWPRRLRLMLQALKCRHRFLMDLRAKKAVLRRSLPLAAAGSYDLLLSVWADADWPGRARASLSDPFWGALPDYLRRRGKRALILVNALDWSSPFERIVAGVAASGLDAVFPEHCLGLGQAACDALRTLFWRPRRTRRLTLAGLDVEPLFADALRLERAKSRQCFALKYRRLGRCLAARAIRLRGALHLYENQPWEKMLRLGLKKAFPEITTKAYLHVPFSRLYLSLVPSPKDIAARRLPDKLLVPGRRWEEIFIREGFPASRLASAAALRHEHLFDRAPERDWNAARRNVLVVGAIDKAELSDCLAKLQKALRDLPDVRAWVKFHPSMSSLDVAAIADTLAREPEPLVAITKTSIAELLPSMDAVLYTSSGVCYEALAMGCVPVFVGSRIRLDMNKLDWFPDACHTVRSAEQLAEVLAWLCAARPQQARLRLEQGREIMESLFSPVCEAGLAAFL